MNHRNLPPIDGILSQHTDIGFTGTQRGMTPQQKNTVLVILRHRGKEGICRHGDCIGADADFHWLCLGEDREIIVHPPTDKKKRAFCSKQRYMVNQNAKVTEVPPLPYLERNHDIVAHSRILIATPGEVAEQLRSGTWATVRYARKAGVPVFLVYPDGSIA